jgi:enamine deaminase RidA (YjgF/YER057c/UK114 family)
LPPFALALVNILFLDQYLGNFGPTKRLPDFADHTKVINGCSDLYVEVFGDRGRHARCAVGMGSVPSNMTVEIEAVVEVA